MLKKMSDFWNSLESISKWSSIANGSIAVLGVLAAMIGATVFVLGRREALLSDREMTNANRVRDELISKNNLETADAKRETAKAMLLVEELRKENGELARRLAPRSLYDQLRIADRLSKFAGTKIRIMVSPDFESRKLSGQLKLVLDWAHWNVEFARGEVIWSGVRIASSPIFSPGFLKGETEEERMKFRDQEAGREEAIRAILGELEKCGIEGCQSPVVMREDTFEGILMHIGPRPDTREAEYMKASQELLSNRNLSWEEHERLVEILHNYGHSDNESASDKKQRDGK